jgi:hypothetical protein
MLRQIGSTDRVEHHVDPVALGDLEDSSGEVSVAIVDGGVRSQGLAVVAFGVGAGRDDDLDARMAE